MEKVDHPESDASKHLDQDGTHKHKHLFEVIQRAMSLGRLDANTAAMTLASFRSEPREGNLNKARRTVSYLVKFKHYAIRIRTEKPELSSTPIPTCE